MGVNSSSVDDAWLLSLDISRQKKKSKQDVSFIEVL
jgi:hypothetical protein